MLYACETQAIRTLYYHVAQATLHFPNSIRYIILIFVLILEVVTEGALYDWLGGGNSRHTNGIRKRSQALWQLVAGCSKDRGCKLENLGFPASKDP
jgi:hypothetical protein